MKETTKGKPKPTAKTKAASIALSKTEAHTVFQRFQGMLKHILSVPKSEIDKREAAYKKKRQSH